MRNASVFKPEGEPPGAVQKSRILHQTQGLDALRPLRCKIPVQNHPMIQQDKQSLNKGRADANGGRALEASQVLGALARVCAEVTSRATRGGPRSATFVSSRPRRPGRVVIYGCARLDRLPERSRLSVGLVRDYAICVSFPNKKGAACVAAPFSYRGVGKTPR